VDYQVHESVVVHVLRVTMPVGNQNTAGTEGESRHVDVGNVESVAAENSDGEHTTGVGVDAVGGPIGSDVDLDRVLFKKSIGGAGGPCPGSSGCPAEVVAEHAAESLTGSDGSRDFADVVSRLDQAIVQSLMVPLLVVMRG
jgi:hypothetical protein